MVELFFFKFLFYFILFSNLTISGLTRAFLNSSLPCFFETRFLTVFGAYLSARLASELPGLTCLCLTCLFPVHGLHMSSTCVTSAHCHTWPFMWVLRIQTESLMFLSACKKPLPSGATFSVLKTRARSFLEESETVAGV